MEEPAMKESPLGSASAGLWDPGQLLLFSISRRICVMFGKLRAQGSVYSRTSSIYTHSLPLDTLESGKPGHETPSLESPGGLACQILAPPSPQPALPHVHPAPWPLDHQVCVGSTG